MGIFLNNNCSLYHKMSGSHVYNSCIATIAPGGPLVTLAGTPVLQPPLPLPIRPTNLQSFSCHDITKEEEREERKKNIERERDMRDKRE